MHTRHPEVFIMMKILYELGSKNVILDRYEKHKMVILNQDPFFEDFPAYVLLFVLFQIPQIKKQMHL